MSSLPDPDSIGLDQTTLTTPPPSGDSKKAEKYLSKLINLISRDKVVVNHTDLAKFDPTSLHDHYWVDLGKYQVEISHSKKSESGQDSFVIIFNNLKQIAQDHSEKVILAYLHLEANQFAKFKNAAEDQLERRRKAEQEKRLEEALLPVDQTLEKLGASFD